MHDALLHKMDDVDLFLDQWIIVRTDGTPVLNGTPEEFEKGFRALIRKENQKAQNVRDWSTYDVWTGEFLDE
jgi:hypothetical protein